MWGGALDLSSLGFEMLWEAPEAREACATVPENITTGRGAGTPRIRYAFVVKGWAPQAPAAPRPPRPRPRARSTQARHHGPGFLKEVWRFPLFVAALSSICGAALLKADLGRKVLTNQAENLQPDCLQVPRGRWGECEGTCRLVCL